MTCHLSHLDKSLIEHGNHAASALQATARLAIRAEEGSSPFLSRGTSPHAGISRQGSLAPNSAGEMPGRDGLLRPNNNNHINEMEKGHDIYR